MGLMAKGYKESGFGFTFFENFQKAFKVEEKIRSEYSGYRHLIFFFLIYV